MVMTQTVPRQRRHVSGENGLNWVTEKKLSSEIEVSEWKELNKKFIICREQAPTQLHHKTVYMKCKEDRCHAQARLRYHSDSTCVTIERVGEHDHASQEEDQGAAKKRRGLSDATKKVSLSDGLMLQLCTKMLFFIADSSSSSITLWFCLGS